MTSSDELRKRREQEAQCTIVCDDDAIEMYKVAMASPLIKVESNQKAKILRDDCTGCRLCVLACPTDAITMIDR